MCLSQERKLSKFVEKKKKVGHFSDPRGSILRKSTSEVMEAHLVGGKAGQANKEAVVNL
jgi:hypothetical protein